MSGYMRITRAEAVAAIMQIVEIAPTVNMGLDALIRSSNWMLIPIITRIGTINMLPEYSIGCESDSGSRKDEATDATMNPGRNIGILERAFEVFPSISPTLVEKVAANGTTSNKASTLVSFVPDASTRASPPIASPAAIA